MAIKDGKGKPEKPFWQALGIRYDPRRSRTVDMSLTYQTARREIASCIYNSRESHHATLLFAAFMQPYFNFIDFQLLIVAYALQNIRRRRVIAVAFYVRRRQRIRRRIWRLPRPVNSWFEVHYCHPTLSNDYFKQQLRVRKSRPDMTSSEAGHRPFWSYVFRRSYVRFRDIRAALVLERWWQILCLSKHLPLNATPA